MVSVVKMSSSAECWGRLRMKPRMQVKASAAKAAIAIQVARLCISRNALYRTHFLSLEDFCEVAFVSGMSASMLRLSRHVSMRLHVCNHACLVIWVPESHICMQLVTAMSCAPCPACGRLGDCLRGGAVGSSRKGGRTFIFVRDAAATDGPVPPMPVCAEVALAPRLRVTIAMSSNRIAMPPRKGWPSFRGEVDHRRLRATSPLKKSHAAYAMSARDGCCCQGSESAHEALMMRRRFGALPPGHSPDGVYRR